jgi:hypothetical protein
LYPAAGGTSNKRRNTFMKPNHAVASPDFPRIRTGANVFKLQAVAWALSIFIGALTHVAATEAGSLQALIDAAPAGGSVPVARGTWDQPVTITKALTLRGESAEGRRDAPRYGQPRFSG